MSDTALAPGAEDAFRNTMRTSAYSETGQTGDEDRDPISMVVVMLDEKGDDGLPAFTEREAMLAAASAMLSLFADAGELGGRYDRLMKAWVDSRIRKLVKHARRGKFDKSVAALKAAGIPHRVGSCGHARAIVVCPLHASTERSERLKPIGGLQLHGFHARPDAEACVDTHEPGLVVTVDTTLGMSDGKMIAQFLHAVQVSVDSLDPERYRAWSESGYAVAPPILGAPLDSDDIVIHDAGFTEIPSGSFTASARLPLRA